MTTLRNYLALLAVFSCYFFSTKGVCADEHGLEWVQTFGGSGEEHQASTCLDGSGNIFLTGAFEDTVDFDPTVDNDLHASVGVQDIFITKYDALGNYQWTRTFGGSGYDGGMSIQTDISGNVYVTGYFEDTVDFDPGLGTDEHSSYGAGDVFMVKYDTNGVYQWTKTFGGVDDDYTTGLALSAGWLYVVGQFYDTVDFDPSAAVREESSLGDGDIFVSKFDLDGNFQSVLVIGGSSYEMAGDIAVDPNGNLFIAGGFSSDDFVPGTNINTPPSKYGVDDIFVIKYDHSGNYEWIRTYGTVGVSTSAYDIQTCASGNVFIAGSFSEVIGFNPTSALKHSSNGSEDAFVAKLDTHGNYQWSQTFGGPGWDFADGIAINSHGDVFLSGGFQGEVDFDPTDGLELKTSSGGFDIFLVKITSAGYYQWAKKIGAAGEDHLSIKIDADNSLVIAGYYEDTLSLETQSGSIDISSNGSGDIFVGKYTEQALTEPTFSISGMVTVQGGPVAGVVVAIGGTAVFPSATTLVDGSYTITGVGELNYVDIYVAGYQIDIATGPLKFQIQANTSLSLVLTPNKIKGYAIYASSGTPAQGVTISDATRTATTDASGYYELLAVPYGEVNITGQIANHSVYVYGSANPIYFYSPSKTVNLKAIADTTLEQKIYFNGSAPGSYPLLALSPETSATSSFITNSTDSIVSCDVDEPHNRVYWITERGNFISGPLQGDSMHSSHITPRFPPNKLYSVGKSFAVDGERGFIYWAGSIMGGDVFFGADAPYAYDDPWIRGIFKSSTEQPTHIRSNPADTSSVVFDNSRAKMYRVANYEYYGALYSKIYISDLDGSNSSVILETNTMNVDAIALDEELQKLYILTSHGLAVADADGSNFSIVDTNGISIGSNSLQFNSSDNRLYWFLDMYGYIYDDYILSVDRNLQDEQVHVFAGESSVSNIIVDAGKVYWSAEGALKRSNIDGTNVEEVVTHPSLVSSIFLARNTQLNKYIWGPVNGSDIAVADLDGSNITFVPISEFGGPLTFLKLEESTGKAYWGERYSANFVRVNLDGSDKESLVDTNTAGNHMPGHVAIDATGNQIYSFISTSTNHYLFRENLDGSNRILLVTLNRSNYSEILGLAVNEQNHDVYYVLREPSGLAEFYRIRIDGNTVIESTLLGSHDGYPSKFSCRNNKLYWSDSIGTWILLSSDLDLSNVTVLRNNLLTSDSFTLNGQYIAWVEENSLYRANLDGSGAKILFGNLDPALLEDTEVDQDGDVIIIKGDHSIISFKITYGGEIVENISVRHQPSDCYPSGISGGSCVYAVHNGRYYYYDGAGFHSISVESDAQAISLGVSITSIDVDSARSYLFFISDGIITRTDLDGHSAVNISSSWSGELLLDYTEVRVDHTTGKVYILGSEWQDGCQCSISKIIESNNDGSSARILRTFEYPVTRMIIDTSSRSLIIADEGNRIRRVSMLTSGDQAMAPKILEDQILFDGDAPIQAFCMLGRVANDLPAIYSVSGTVTIEGMLTAGQVVNGGSSLGLATTLGNGSYAFNNINSGAQANLSVTRAGYTFQEATGQPLNFVVNANSTRNFLGTANRIHGHAVYASSGAFAPGVSVTDGIRTDITDSNGYYELFAVPNGTYTVQGSIGGYSVALSGTSNPITISDDSVTVDLMLSAPSNNPQFTVSGYVRIDGSPVFQQIVQSGSSIGDVSTNVNGIYSFSNVNQGTVFNMSVSRSGYAFVEASSQPLSFTVSSNRVINFEGTPNKISGIARYASLKEEPAAGVLVSIGSLSTVTNELGEYELTAVPNGTYTLTGSLNEKRVEAEEGSNPIAINNNSKEVNLWVYSETSQEVLAPWNGFLTVTAIVEVMNTGEEDLDVNITLFKMEGNRSQAQPSSVSVTIPSGTPRDFILNDMVGFEEDRYGIVRINFSHQQYNGRVVYYKPKDKEIISWRENIQKQFDYAFVNPFVGPITGTSYTSFNTYQPSFSINEQENLIPNWLTIINAEESHAQWFTIKKYNETGELIQVEDDTGTVRENCNIKDGNLYCKVQPMGRIDIDGGHVFPGPSRVGLVEVVPDNSEGKYSANLIRYGMDSPPTTYTTSYSFGMCFQTHSGISKMQAMPVWNVGGSDNWIEVSNVNEVKEIVDFELYDNSGLQIDKWARALEPKMTAHYNISSMLAQSSAGIVRLQPRSNQKILAQSLVYYRWIDGTISASLSMQSREPYSKTIHGTYNTFLSMYNWLKITNLTDQKRNLELTINRSDATNIVLPPYGGIDVPLHDEKYSLEPNSVGTFSIRDTEPGKIFANMIRVKPARNLYYDFVLGTEVE